MQALTILAIIWLPILLAAKLWYDLSLWFNREIKNRSNKTVNHKAEWAILAILSSPAIYQLAMQLTLPWYYAIPLTGAMAAFFIWVFFDGLYNKIRGYHWFYTGSNDADDANTDNFLQRFGTAGHVVKYAVFLATTIFYIKFFI